MTHHDITNLPIEITLKSAGVVNNIQNSLNILIISEGYPAGSDFEKLFTTDVLEITDRFFKEPPFNMKKDPNDITIREMINFFYVFIPIAPGDPKPDGFQAMAGIPFYYMYPLPAPQDPAYGLAARYNETKTVVGLKYRFYSKVGAEEDNDKHYKEDTLGISLDYENRIQQIIDRLVLPNPDVTGKLQFLKNYWHNNPQTTAILVYDEFSQSAAIWKEDRSAYIPVIFRAEYSFNFWDNFTVTGSGAYAKLTFQRRIPFNRPGFKLSEYLELSLRFIHEIAHAIFGLDDEYEKKVDYGWGLLNYANKDKDLLESGNVHSHKDLMPTGIAYPDIDVSKITWYDWETFPGSGVDMIRREVKDEMEATRRPLSSNIVPDPSNLFGSETQAPDNKAIVKAIRPYYASSIIGLYEGALYVSHYAYRPTGLCLMRCHGTYELKDASGKPVPVPYGVHFCYVCKYIAVVAIASHLSLNNVKKTQLLENMAHQWPPNDR